MNGLQRRKRPVIELPPTSAWAVGGRNTFESLIVVSRKYNDATAENAGVKRVGAWSEKG
jgi:hypothetical protein